MNSSSYVKMVYGKPRHSQSQYSVEYAYRDIKAVLAAWMSDNNSEDWPNVFKLIHFQKNQVFNSG